MTDPDFDLDGRAFDMESSTSSAVDPVSPTRFRYREDAGVIWGDYDRDTVDIGRFTGTRTGDVLDIAFVHRDRAGRIVTGTARSVISADPTGALRLTEEFADAAGRPQVSVCVEVTER